MPKEEKAEISLVLFGKVLVMGLVAEAEVVPLY